MEAIEQVDDTKDAGQEILIKYPDKLNYDISEPGFNYLNIANK
jgi:hypothetical protein